MKCSLFTNLTTKIPRIPTNMGCTMSNPSFSREKEKVKVKIRSIVLALYSKAGLVNVITTLKR